MTHFDNFAVEAIIQTRVVISLYCKSILVEMLIKRFYTGQQTPQRQKRNFTFMFLFHMKMKEMVVVLWI